VCFNHDYKFNTDNLPVGYTALCLSAEFATELADFRIIDGDYGIAGIIYGRDKNGALSQMEIKMGCAEMFGNVYNFDGYYPQQLIVNIKDVLNVVEGAQLWFYQNADFTTNKKDLIPHSIKEIDSNNKEIEILYPDNIFVKNISLTFGYNKNDLQNDTFIIKTKDALFFSESDLNKELYLSWIHKHENEYVELNAENLKNYYPESDYEITWQ
jgi:hypothetical protein